MVQEDGTMEVFNEWVDVAGVTFPSNFAPGDGVAIGDLHSRSDEEIVLADLSDNQFEVMLRDQGANTYSLRYGISQEMTADDGWALGDVLGDELEELLFADVSEDTIVVYAHDDEVDLFAELDSFPFLLNAGDSLTTADIVPLGKDEILIARGSRSGRHDDGDIEILLYTPGSVPGDRDALDELMDAGGDWANAMGNGLGGIEPWTDSGYLLLVGETEVIPAFNYGYWLPFLEHGRVDYSDRRYADTRGDSNLPELGLGRIVGNDPVAMRTALESSIAIATGFVDLENRNALAVSGHHRGLSGEADDIDFSAERENVSGQLSAAGFTVSELHCPSNPTFFAGAADKDLIYLAGHGNWNAWDSIGEWAIASSFLPGPARTVIYGAACLTGRYAEGSAVVDAFLARGASAYIGATEVSISPWSARLSGNYLTQLMNRESVGKALKIAKRHRLGVNTFAWDPVHNKYACDIHLLFGDPKLELEWLPTSTTLGQEPAGASLPATLSAAEPLTTIGITVPDYHVAVSGTTHSVEIPGGETLIVPGRPMVPTFQVEVGYPAGVQIQDVTLDEKAGLVLTTGLNIPTVTVGILAPGARPATAEQAAGQDEDWWPGREFAWDVWQGPSNTITLALTIYPFQYYRQTTSAQFHNAFTFTVAVSTTEVEIVGGRLGRLSYDPGDIVGADIYLQSSADGEQDLIVETVVHYESAGVPVDGLPLRTLHGLEGLASLALEWDSTGFDPGDYLLRINIRDPGGSLLGWELLYFQLGGALGRIAELSAGPEAFSAGDLVTTSLTFENIGSAVISGTAVIRVRNSAGAPVAEFRHDTGELAAGGSLVLADVWDTAGMPEGLYTVAGYVAYAGQTARPEMVQLVSKSKVYLPVVVRDPGGG